MKNIENNSSVYKYFDLNNYQILDDLFSHLSQDLIRSFDFKKYLDLSANYNCHPNVSNQLLKNIVAIPPKTKWVFDGFNFKEQNNRKKIKPEDKSLQYLINYTKKFISVFSDYKIGVEVSGGLDTSIIISALRDVGYNPFLIGTKTNRFEFRTESQIQYLLVEKSEFHLIEIDQCLPFSNLKNVPRHCLPSSSSIFYNMAHSSSAVCKENNVGILLNGMGLDLLFANDISTSHSLLQTFKLDDNWFNEYVYRPIGIKYYSAAFSNQIRELITELRFDKEEDPQKLWARNFFSEILPKEITNYSYKADNSGLFIDGFINAYSDIQDIYHVVSSYYGIDYFSDSSLEIMLKNINKADIQMDKSILASVSYAVWLYGLIAFKV